MEGPAAAGETVAGDGLLPGVAVVGGGKDVGDYCHGGRLRAARWSGQLSLV